MNSDAIDTIAVIACLITFFVSRKVLQEDLKIGPPNMLAACVAILAFLGLRGKGQELTAVIPIPYEALAIALLLLFLLFLFGRITGRLAAKWKHRQNTLADNMLKPMRPKDGSQQDNGSSKSNQHF